MKSSPLLLAAIVGFLLVSGCAPPPRMTVPPPEPGLQQSLLRQLEENLGTFDALRGFARVRVAASGRSLSWNQVLFVQAPDRLRAEVLSPFGQPILLVATDGESVTAIAPGEGRFYRGAASHGNLQRFTRIPLELEDLVGLLLYRVPPLPAAVPSLTALPEGYLLTLHGGTLRQELLFDSRHRLVRASWLNGDELLVQAGYGSFSGSGPAFPRQLSLRVPTREVEATVSFSEIDLNPEIPAERFVLSAPEGYKVEPLP